MWGRYGYDYGVVNSNAARRVLEAEVGISTSPGTSNGEVRKKKMVGNQLLERNGKRTQEGPR